MFIRFYRLVIHSSRFGIFYPALWNVALLSGSTSPPPLLCVNKYTVCKGKGVWGSGQSPFTSQFFGWRHFALPSMSLIFLQVRGQERFRIQGNPLRLRRGVAGTEKIRPQKPPRSLGLNSPKKIFLNVNNLRKSWNIFPPNGVLFLGPSLYYSTCNKLTNGAANLPCTALIPQCNRRTLLSSSALHFYNCNLLRQSIQIFKL